MATAGDSPEPLDGQARIAGCLFGVHIGAALASPLHWYYSHDVLKEHAKTFYASDDTGRLVDMLPVHPEVVDKHPDSWDYFSMYKPAQDCDHICGDKVALWDVEGTNYHGHLAKGEDSLNLACVAALVDTINKTRTYERDTYLRAYTRLITGEGQHNDTYISGFHRHFAAEWYKGTSWYQCGSQEDCLSGLVLALPLMVAIKDAGSAFAAVWQHLILTHRKISMMDQSRIWLTMMHRLRDDVASFESTLNTAFDDLVDGKVDLNQAMMLSDEEAFYGKNKVFSVR